MWNLPARIVEQVGDKVEPLLAGIHKERLCSNSIKLACFGLVWLADSTRLTDRIVLNSCSDAKAP